MPGTPSFALLQYALLIGRMAVVKINASGTIQRYVLANAAAMYLNLEPKLSHWWREKKL